MAAKYMVKVKISNVWKTQACFDDIESASIINRVNISNGIKSKVVKWDQTKTCIRFIEFLLAFILIVIAIGAIVSGAFIEAITAPEVFGGLFLLGLFLVIFGIVTLTSK